MDFLQLQYFQAVAEAGSFTRAAETLHLTQSALSRSVQKLEEELGLRLFEREGNHITLNHFGRRFLQDTLRLLSQYADCTRAVREMAGMERGDVRIAISKEVFVDHLVKRFLVEHPRASFHCYLLSPEQMRDALIDGTIDMAVTSQRPLGNGILWQDLYQDRLEVILSPRHPLAAHPRLSLDQLRNERFIVTNSNYNMDNVIFDLCVQAGFEPRIMYEGTSTDMPMCFVSDGSAIMITPHSISKAVAEIVPKQSVVITVPLNNEYPGMEKTLGVAFKASHYQSEAARAFYERMVEYYSGLRD